MRFSESVAQGRTVVAAGGQTLGTVETLTIDDETWRVEVLQVKLASESADELGVYWNYFHAGRVDVPTRLVHSVSDTVLLAVTVEELHRTLSAEAASAQAP
ncbi:PRC-barrel domain containing protein [Corallococcus sp. bb12-1]|uniref:PRC-barrel domain-containing protein n=1 Tax=Corallococcus sp. bb12-1 TaxID=2996784 RepID=UPI002270C620|nr:PRC-barrel domain containing protein [Corallococcus sp. bb12-1]MCY1045077.1 PRC-barrel domain containing protein [Corallococcus sp. bb12-1]